MIIFNEVVENKVKEMKDRLREMENENNNILHLLITRQNNHFENIKNERQHKSHAVNMCTKGSNIQQRKAIIVNLAQMKRSEEMKKRKE